MTDTALPGPDEYSPAAPDFRTLLAAHGTVGADLLAVDWSSTPLGPVSDWPQSLRTVVEVLLSSRFAMWMAWGPELTFLCNDTYRTDTLGSKYPWALGRPAREVWAEIWPDIGPRIDTVLATGASTWDESLRLLLERSGYTEETYHTFSYSPLTDDHGDRVGMLCVVSEVTQEVVGRRRMGTLQNLGANLAATNTEPEVLDAVRRSLGADGLSVPFSLLYLFDDDGDVARLACTTGTAEGSAVAPLVVDSDSVWPIAQMRGEQHVTLSDLSARFSDLPTGSWPIPPTQALLQPLTSQSQHRPYGFLVTALNPYRRLDEAYEGFLSLISSQIAAGIASARTYEAERERAEQLAELDQAKTMFFTNVSHEFRTPLTLMVGPIEDALADELPDRQRERIELLRRSSGRLLRLVNSLLDFSRLESGRATARYERLDLAALTTELAEQFRPAVGRAGLQLVVDCTALREDVYADREMWSKIVMNLLSNAFKFTFTGSITLTLAPSAYDDGLIELSVTDTGIGVSESDQSKLFDRFHRVAGAKSRTFEGSGVGLAMVSEFATLHRGTVSVTSAPGSGSTFTVRIPRGTAGLLAVSAPDVHPERRALRPELAHGYVEEALRWLDDTATGVEPVDEPTVDNPAADPDDARPVVLVVDDNGDMRSYIKALLESDYVVLTAGDGRAALSLVAGRHPDLVLTDVMMPEVNGFELLSALRGRPETAGIPVIMLSARAGENASVEGLDAGADDYLTKPFAAVELLARVRSALQLENARREAGRDRALLEEVRSARENLDQAQRLAQLGSWRIDLITGEMTGSAEMYRLMHLTPSEFSAIGMDGISRSRIYPDDRQKIFDALEAARRGEPQDYEFRLILPDGSYRICRNIGETAFDDHGRAIATYGSMQDITEQRAAQRALAQAEVAQQTALHEHRIAEALQRSLLPTRRFSNEHLEVSTFYQAGVNGTRVGGDWYDVIELGAGRTALVIGDVMGRGVPAAAVMGQLRAALRAYARIDLPPAELLELMDSTVRDLRSNQIVTCVYAIFDPWEQTLTYTNAGHLPPLLAIPGEPAQRLDEALGPPLGAGPVTLKQVTVDLPPGTTMFFYTDGLIERRGVSLDERIDLLGHTLDVPFESVEDLTAIVIDGLMPGGADDVATLVARTATAVSAERVVSWAVPGDDDAVAQARRVVESSLTQWGVPSEPASDMVLMASELVTNALIHGQPPVSLRLRRTNSDIVLEVADRSKYAPRKLRPSPREDHGRGLQIVSILADRWGARITEDGKAMWCMTDLRRFTTEPAGLL